MRNVEELTSITEVGRLMQCKRIRWAASVYGRHLPEQREVVEPILREWVEEDAEMRWMEGCLKERTARIEELDEGGVEEWTDGSRIDEMGAWGQWLRLRMRKR